MGIDLIGLAFAFGAAARLWHLAATDHLTEKLRDRAPQALQRWIACPRCSGFWWMAITVTAWMITRDTWTLIQDGTWNLAVETLIDTAVIVLMGSLALNWVFFATREAFATAAAIVEDATADAQEARQRQRDTPRERL